MSVLNRFGVLALICAVIAPASSVFAAETQIQISPGGSVKVKAGDTVNVTCSMTGGPRSRIGIACRCVEVNGQQSRMRFTSFYSDGTKSVQWSDLLYSHDYCASELQYVSGCD